MAAIRPLLLGSFTIAYLASSAHADRISLGNWSFWSTAMSNSSTAPANVPSPAPILSVAPTPVTAPTVTPTVAPVTVTPVVTAAAPVVTQPAVTSALPTTTLATAIATPSSGTADAYINFGTGPYAQASSITTGGAQAWYNSSAITSLFGGQPTTQQQQNFDATVLARVQQTFNLAGINVKLTDNPNVSAAHSLSLVSNTVSSLLPSAIGMTNVGGNGFSFIDNIAPSASNVDQLEWIAAHNISHELMLAFGVGENYDQSGNYIDARNASWNMMVSPTSTFSSSAAQAINQAMASQNSGNGLGTATDAQVLTEAQVITPEPTTILSWTLAALAVAIAHRRRAARQLAI